MAQDSATLTIRLPKDLKDQLTTICHANDLTHSQVIRQMLRATLSQVQVHVPTAPPPKPPTLTTPKLTTTSHRPGNQQKRRK